MRIRLNARGRFLVANALNGVPIRVQARARAFGGAAVSARAKGRAVARVQRVIPNAPMFEPNSADLTAYGKRFLRSAAKGADSIRRVRCEGFTASVGIANETAFSRALARARAQTACAFLRRAGIRTRTLVVRPVGRRTR